MDIGLLQRLRNERIRYDDYTLSNKTDLQKYKNQLEKELEVVTLALDDRNDPRPFIYMVLISYDHKYIPFIEMQSALYMHYEKPITLELIKSIEYTLSNPEGRYRLKNAMVYDFKEITMDDYGNIQEYSIRMTNYGF